MWSDLTRFVSYDWDSTSSHHNPPHAGKQVTRELAVSLFMVKVYHYLIRDKKLYIVHRCDLDDSQSSTGSTPSNSYFWSLGVLPVLLYHCCGSYVPVSVFNSSGSTPKGTIPFFWEHSHKNGIVLVGVLPDLLKCRYWEWYWQNI